MKYIITSYFIANNGGIVFSPENDVEVFDNYVRALRWMVRERDIAKRCEYDVIIKKNDNPSLYGREWFFTMVEIHGESKTIMTIARINENGFH